MSLIIIFIGSTNFLCFPVATERKLQPPSFSGYNLKESPTPQFSGYNQKEATTPYFLRLQLEGSSNSPILWIQPKGGYNPLCSSDTTERWLQPPVLALSSRPDIEVEIWNHCHTINVRYTVVNLYQSTYNQPVTTCTNNLCQQVPYINLYHKQMHQPCTKPIPQPVPSTSASTMHQICTNHASNTHKL
jgi:hypothetical protein